MPTAHTIDEVALRKFLVDAFDPPEFDRLLSDARWEKVREELPAVSGEVDYFFKVIRQLSKHGLLGPALIELLSEARRFREAEVRALMTPSSGAPEAVAVPDLRALVDSQIEVFRNRGQSFSAWDVTNGVRADHPTRHIEHATVRPMVHASMKRRERETPWRSTGGRYIRYTFL